MKKKMRYSKKIRPIYVDNKRLLSLTKEAKNSGKFFTVSCMSRKAGRGVIKMTARGGVKKYSKGIGYRFNPEEKGLMTIWTTRKRDDKDAGYRFVNLRGLKKLRYKKRLYVLKNSG